VNHVCRREQRSGFGPTRKSRPGPAGPLTLMSFFSTASTTGTFSTLTSVKLISDGSCRGEAGPEDVGDQALMRGLDTGIGRLFVRGCPCLRSGVDM